MTRFKLGGPSKLHSAKPWKAIHLVMLVSEKEKGIKNVLPTRHWYILFLNMSLHAGYHAEKDR